MPIDPKKYAKNFPKRSKECIKKAKGKCQGCGLAHGDERNNKKQWLNAHHPDLDPWNPNARLIALCPRCHRKREPYDAKRAAGQLPLPIVTAHITYQLQYRKCNKPACNTCRESKGHGPYWYAYWKEDGRLRSRYIGKKRPEDA